eukprot:TRINITY_DN109728_c0_g1_i1.p1 TRINITY_DN109728_c0_g1~~TRINITY_DN109728_c0_g1_i1.p1  ORF type:complete len:401 (-),score=36.91 TRINITY_DN109728_c0_g1_i1:117-1319(-)
MTILLARRNFRAACVRSILIVPVSQVSHLLTQAPHSQQIYGNHPLATMSTTRRGRILERTTRSVMASMQPEMKIEDPEHGTNVNGGRRGNHQTTYDWKANGRRVECKSSMMTWHRGRRMWGFNYAGVKLPFENIRKHALFDELLLTLFTPRGIYIYAHDLTFRITARGKATAINGYNIRIFAASNQHNWSEALDCILGKLDSMDNGCQRVAHISLNDTHLLRELNSNDFRMDAYHGLPLTNMSQTQRGLVIQDIVRFVDEAANLYSKFKDAEAGLQIDGKLRSRYNAAHDWLRDGIRVECKSAVIQKSTVRRVWFVRFSAVKLELFDELLLAIYSPCGIYIYRHDLCLGLSKAGVAMPVHGWQIWICSSKAASDWKAALADILTKLDASKCQQIALVKFC